jgi:CHAT domain-containing protein
MAGIPRDSVAGLVAATRDGLGAEGIGGRALPVLEGAERAGTPRSTSRARGSSGPLDGLSAVLLPAALARRLPRSGTLVVIPHGSLGLVPFAALPADVRHGGTARGDRLGTRHAIHYAPSLTTLGVVTGGETPGLPPVGDSRGAMDRRALVVGDPAMPTVRTPRRGAVRLPALPAAGREGRWVAHALGVAPLTGLAATERVVRARIAGASIIHLATHGFAFSSDARVLDSFIALASDSTGESANDGLLTVGEVLDAGPRMVADLVVLSACQTGLGNLKQAEGTVGLQRAFLARGARSVLVSLWSVSDEATELLMRRFYTHWLKDSDHPGKAEALRRAQRDVRAVPRFREPRYWAAFQLVGAS